LHLGGIRHRYVVRWLIHESMPGFIYRARAEAATFQTFIP
jgi:hypothetical protein